MDRQAIIEELELIAELERRGVAVTTATDEPPAPRFIENPKRLIQGLLDGLRPEPSGTVTEWADQHRWLSSEGAKEHGQYSSARTPYLREIMEALSPSSGIEIVVFMKASQIGASETAYNTIGCYMDWFPCPMMIYNPTDEDMRKNSQIRVDPMIQHSPSLKAKVSKSKSRSSRNSALFKSGPGFVLVMAGANSPSPFASTAGRLVIVDEFDRMPDNVGDEGSPLGLIEARTSTFGTERKIFVLSTPTTTASKIAALYEKTDKRMFHVPCPHCQEPQVLEWENFKYQRLGEDDYRCTLFCIHCAAEIEEKHKTWMLENGQWISTNPEFASAKKRGYHLSALYSPMGWLSWGSIAAKHDEAYNVKNDANLQTTFENTILGLTYSANQERPPWEGLLAKSGKYKRNELPAGTPEAAPGKPLFVTIGCDVQRDRIELEIVAWGMGKESWSVDYRVIQGNTESPTDPCWEGLAAVMAETWEVSGVMMPAAFTAIDSSDQTKVVTQVVDNLDKRGFRILPVKGIDNQDASLVKGSGMFVKIVNGKEVRHGKPMWRVGVSALKAELYGFLRLEPNLDESHPAGSCHFPDYNGDYFKSLTAEAIVLKVDKNGYPKEKWVKLHPRNEALDCRNYARAVADYNGFLNYNAAMMDVLRGQLAAVVASPEPVEREVVKKKPKRDRFSRDVY